MTHTDTQLEKKNPRDLVGYGVGTRCGARDVIESIGNSSILHYVAGMNDVRACGGDLNLNLITDTSRSGE